jgi:hypothetical protein
MKSLASCLVSNFLTGKQLSTRTQKRRARELTLSAPKPRDLLLAFCPCRIDTRLMAGADGVEPRSVVLQFALLAVGRHLVKNRADDSSYSLGNLSCPLQSVGSCAKAFGTTQNRAGCRAYFGTESFGIRKTGSDCFREDWRFASRYPAEARDQKGCISHVSGRQRNGPSERYTSENQYRLLHIFLSN